MVRPRVIVALGATAAARGVRQADADRRKMRQQAIQLSDQAQGVVTYHPSYLLRLPDEAARARAYGDVRRGPDVRLGAGGRRLTRRGD